MNARNDGKLSRRAIAIERVRAELVEAFAHVPEASFEGAHISHQNYIRIRKDLPLFRPEDLHWVLPRVLLDLTDTHTDDRANAENAEYVLMHLDVERRTSERSRQEQVALMGPDYVKQREESSALLRRLAVRVYPDFSQEQALAIYHWLQLASCWEEFEDMEDEMQSALAYWRERASGCSHENAE